MNNSTHGSFLESWAARHQLTSMDDNNYYVSSTGGDCFQIWLNLSDPDRASLHAAFVDGPNDNEWQQHWNVTLDNLNQALENAYSTVVARMMPHERSYASART